MRLWLMFVIGCTLYPECYGAGWLFRRIVQRSPATYEVVRSTSFSIRHMSEKRSSGVKVPKISAEKVIEDPDLLAGGDEGILAFLRRIEVANLPKDVLARHYQSVQYHNDIVEAEHVKATESAKKMLQRNRPIEEIIEDIGLTLEEIETIQNSHSGDERV